MSTVTLFFIGGVIQPSQPELSCGLESRCYEPYFPKPITHTSVHTLDIWGNMRDRFEEKVDRGSLNFWAQRMVVHFAATPLLCSVSFYPSDLASNQTWFIQKDKVDPPLEGFYAPYLSKNEQKKWNCIEGVQRLDRIRNQADIDQSVEDLEIRTLLNYFLQDSLSIMVGFTYFVDTVGGRETRFWYKSLS